MGRKVIQQKPRADPRAYVGKKRDRSNMWKPSRNPLLEQMNPMPPGTYSKGDLRRVGREATFDPLRGAFVVLARPDDPEPDTPERRRGLRNVDSCREPGQIKALLSEPESRVHFKLPRIHKRPPPEKTHINNDLGTMMQMRELTASDKAVLWSKYQKAMELSLRREGDLDGTSWRHRATHEPASPLHHGRLPNELAPRAPPPYGTTGECPSPATVRSGRRPCKGFTEDQGERLLSWKEMQGDRLDPPIPRKLPPSYEADTHMDTLLNDERSVRLAPPAQKQRRHIEPGHAGEIVEAISPTGDRERRELHALEMHEFTVLKKPTPPPLGMVGGTTRYRRPSQYKQK
ncbi:unnamed protein product [Pylaiella littoralis]